MVGCVLVLYDEKRKLILVCDVFLYGVGVVILYVMDDGEEYFIVFVLRIFIKSERNYL